MTLSKRNAANMPQLRFTPEAVNKLEDELGGIFTVAKTHHYKQGQKNNRLASVIPEAKYRLVMAYNITWTHTTPGDPGTYSQSALTVGNAAAQRDQIVAEHKILLKNNL